MIDITSVQYQYEYARGCNKSLRRRPDRGKSKACFLRGNTEMEEVEGKMIAHLISIGEGLAPIKVVGLVSISIIQVGKRQEKEKIC
jgi:hypothetical protein